MKKKENEKLIRRLIHELHEVIDEYNEKNEMESETKQNVQAKKRKIKGSLDRFVTSPLLDVLKGRKDRKGIFGVCDN